MNNNLGTTQKKCSWKNGQRSLLSGHLSIADKLKGYYSFKCKNSKEFIRLLFQSRWRNITYKWDEMNDLHGDESESNWHEGSNNTF